MEHFRLFFPGPPAALCTVERANLGDVGQVVISLLPPIGSAVNLCGGDVLHGVLAGGYNLCSLNIC